MSLIRLLALSSWELDITTDIVMEKASLVICFLSLFVVATNDVQLPEAPRVDLHFVWMAPTHNLIHYSVFDTSWRIDGVILAFLHRRRGRRSIGRWCQPTGTSDLLDFGCFLGFSRLLY